MSENEKVMSNPISARSSGIRLSWNRNIAFYIGVPLVILYATLFFEPYYQRLLIEMMIFALLAMSLDLLVGYTGIVSFGHAAFFGLTMYTTGILITKLGWPFILASIVAVLFTIFVAALIGWFCVRLSGIQFAMLTLAFGMLIWTIITKWREVTSGLDGFSVSKGLSINIGGMELSLTDPLILLFITAGVLIVSFWSMNRLVKSNFGQVLIAIRENEDRTGFLGFSNTHIKLQVFLISAAYASIAGILFMLLKTFVSPDFVHWAFSGNILMMTILGGMGTIFGPLLGAGLFVWLQDWASSYTENWMIIIGFIFVLVVLYLPRGVFGWMFKK